MGPFAFSPPGAPPPCAASASRLREEEEEESVGRAGSSGAAVTAARLKAIGDALQGRTEARGPPPGIGSVMPGAPALAWLSLAALAALACLSRRGSR